MISLKDLKENKVKIPESTFDNSKISIEDLEIQINEAKHGKAKVDKTYVGLADGLNHIFEYKYDYAKFLENITYVIKKGKERKSSSDVYKSKHKVIIQ
jgi:hypothetical protein